jgi:hypothetical protein
MLVEPKKKKINKTIQHESDLAKDLGGKRRVMSGANRAESIYNRGAGYKGDVVLPDFEIEAKRTAKRSIGIRIDWLIRMAIGAFAHGKKPAIQIQFDSLNTICDNKWILIEQSVFKELLERANENKTQR